MSVTLTITDNMDGTGGVATIAGSDGDENTLYRGTWNGQTGAVTWTLVGSRTGDGTIVISASPGFYVFMLVNGAGVAGEVVVYDPLFVVTAGSASVFSPLYVASSGGGGDAFVPLLVYQPLTDADEESILYRAMNAAKVSVQSLNLAVGLPVDVRTVPRLMEGEACPRIAIHPIGSETFPGVMTATDDIGLPFAVTIIDVANQDPTANLNRFTLWRQKILKKLRYQRMAGVPEGMMLVPDSAMIVHPTAFDSAGLIMSPLYFRLATRTERG